MLDCVLSMASQQNSNTEQCHAAIKEVCQKAVPCIKNCIRSWQQKHQLTLGNCTGIKACPTTGGKPKASKRSCASCVSWGQALEAEVYPPGGQIQWPNINPTLLSTDPFEVAKAFVLRLKPGKTYSTFGDLDPASLLMIMKGFKEFHQGDNASHSVIEKVSEIRNKLAHLSIDCYVNSSTRDRYFDDIRGLVDLLEQLHPNTFTSDTVQEVHDEVNNILSCSAPVDVASRPLVSGKYFSIVSVIVILVGCAIYALVWGYCGFVSCNNGVCINLISTYQCRCDSGYYGRHCELGGDGACNSSPCRHGYCRNVDGDYNGYRCFCNDGFTGQNCGTEEEPFNVTAIRRQLRKKYIQQRGKIPILPGVPESFADMKEFFIDLELEVDRRGQVRRGSHPLDSLGKIVSLKSESGDHYKRILVTGNAGTGKTTLVSKLAFDWAKREQYFKKCKLLFVLDIRWIKPNTDLIDVVQSQLLNRLSRKGMLNYLSHNSSFVGFIFDGYDEWEQEQSKDIRNIFHNRWLQESIVLVTTRPQRVHDFTSMFGTYVKIHLYGFSQESIFKYVNKFLQTDNDKSSDTKYALENLKGFLKASIQAREISSTPIMLSMICMMWKEKQELPDKITPLFERALSFMIEHKRNLIDSEEINFEKSDILKELGEPALHHLFEPEDRLIFKSNEFNSTTLNYALHIGLMVKEKYSYEHGITYVTFVHKTFQEFCAATYWVSLLETDEKRFDDYLQKIDLQNQVSRLRFDLLLRFSCGLEENAASFIILYITKPYPTESELNFLEYGRSCNDFFGFVLIFSNILLYESNRCEVIKSLVPILQNGNKISLKTYYEVSSSSHGINNIQANQMIFMLSCVASIQQKEPQYLIFGNISHASLIFDDYTLDFITDFSCENLERLELHYQCSKKVNFELIYTRHSKNSKQSIGIKVSCTSYLQRGEHLAMLPCLKTFTESISNFFGKCYHTKQIPIQDLSFVGCELLQIDKIIHILFEQTSLVEVSFVHNILDQNNMAHLLNSIQNSFIQRLRIRNNIVGKSGILIKPFVLTLHTLILNQVHITHRTWNDIFNVIIGISTHMYPYYSAALVQSGRCTQYLPLRQLDISHNDVSKSFSKLGLILQCTPYMQYLNLQHTEINSSNIEEFRLKFISANGNLEERKIICKSHLSIKRLDLSQNNLSGAMDNLVVALLCMPYLINLDLAETQLNKNDIRQFKLSMMRDTNESEARLTRMHKLICMNDLQLEVLNLAKNSLSDSMDHLIQVLQCMPNITRLILDGSGLVVHDIKTLLLGLVDLRYHNIQGLDLTGNEVIGAEKELSALIKRSQVLNEIRLHHTKLEREFTLVFRFSGDGFCEFEQVGCMFACAFIRSLPKYLFCSRCTGFSGATNFSSDFFISRNDLDSFVKPRFNIHFEYDEITVLNGKVDDPDMCYSEDDIQIITKSDDFTTYSWIPRDDFYFNCEITGNDKALTICKQLLKKLNVTVNQVPEECKG